MTTHWAITPMDGRASLGTVKPLRCAPTPVGASHPATSTTCGGGPGSGLTGPAGRLGSALT